MSQLNLTSPAVVKSILRERGLRPKKRLGQNFLVDRNVLNRILETANPGPDDAALEIGAGLGVVTTELATRAGSVVAVEMDKDLVPILQDMSLHNVEIVHADFLHLDLDQFLEMRFGSRKVIVVANLPYYITTPIIVRLLETKEHIGRIVIMTQKEVAERLVAAPGTPEYGSISVLVQYTCEVEIAAHVSRNVFYPPPEVDSALLRLTIRDKPTMQPKDERLFFAVVRAAFGKRRKTLLNALAGASELGLSKSQAEEILCAAGIDVNRRGETLNLSEFAAIADAVT